MQESQNFNRITLGEELVYMNLQMNIDMTNSKMSEYESVSVSKLNAKNDNMMNLQFTETQTLLKENTLKIREILKNWREICLAEAEVCKYKQKIDDMSEFMNKNEIEIIAELKEFFQFNSIYHDDIIELKLKELIKHLKKEISYILNKNNIEPNLQIYYDILSEIQKLDFDKDENIIKLTQLRLKYWDTCIILDKFKEWHTLFTKKILELKNKFSNINFDIPDFNNKDLKDSITKKYMNIDYRKLYEFFDEKSIPIIKNMNEFGSLKIRDNDNNMTKMISNNPSNNILANRYGLPLLYEDIRRLLPGEWLNDRIINFFNEYITEKIEKFNMSKDSNSKLILFKSFFFIAITSAGVLNMNNYNYKRVQKYTDKYMTNNNVSIFKNYWRLGYIVNLNNNHWAFVIIDNKEYKIILYDSMRYAKENANDDIVLKIFQRYIKDEIIDKENLIENQAQIFSDQYKLYIGSCPRQKNTDDCGVHVCKNIHIFSLGQNINEDSYNHDDIQQFRYKIFELILKIGINKEGYLKFDQLI